MVLRIEDTDPERSRDELVEGIQRSLQWLGLDWDEGPVRQSQRMHLYAEAAERLVAEGHAYWCDCTQADLDARARRRRRLRRVLPRPRPRARTRAPPCGSGCPTSGETVVHDLIRGDVVFDHASIEDFVVQRADGSPMFLLANAVDDADMGITHVIRGEDLLPSTPKVLLLRRALGVADDPIYAHLPLIVNEKRQKLSKRRDDVAVEEYRERGYLPEAMRNYLALLGWAPPDDREIVPIEEMVAEFQHRGRQAVAGVLRRHQARPRQRRVHPGPAGGDVRPGVAAVAGGGPALAARELRPGPLRGRWRPMVQERVKTLAEVPARGRLPLPRRARARPGVVGEGGREGARPPRAILDEAAAAFADCAWDTDVLHDTVLAIGEAHGLKLGKAQAPVRVAVTGRTVGPPLFESLKALGRERTLERLRAARRRLMET